MAEVKLEVNLKGILAQFDELDKKLKASGLESKPFTPSPGISAIGTTIAKGAALASLVPMYPHITAFIKIQAISEEWIMKLAALMDVDPGKVEPFIEESYSIKRPVMGDNMVFLIDERHTREVIYQADLFNRVAEFIFRYYLTGNGLPAFEEVKRIWE